jgi:hypothetical protein
MCVICIAFVLQRWLHENVSVLCYKYIACLFSKWYSFEARAALMNFARLQIYKGVNV